MQQIVALLSRQAPRAAARLSTAGNVRSAAALAFSLSKRQISSARILASEAAARVETSEAEASTDEYVPVPFEKYEGIDPKTMQAIKTIMKFKTASKVQHQIISRMPITGDIMVKAKTGTGKTTAFLIPAIEALQREYKADPARSSKGRKVGCLVISPTRELAAQIAVEARKLASVHGWNVQLLIGGESSGRQLRELGYKRSDIVIGTPGRLADFLKNQPLFAQQAEDAKLLVLDEADVLLEMGFRTELDEITSRISDQRQTFLVSATLDRKMRDLASSVFNPGFEVIDCVDKDDANTHANVKQEYIEVGFEKQQPVLCDLIESHISQNKAEGRGSKIIVFMPTIKSVDMYSNVLRSMLRKGDRMQVQNARRGGNFFDRGRGRPSSPRGGDTVEFFALHGGARQQVRSRISDNFRNFPVTPGNTSILVTTDVSARGVDYPNVSMVIQGGIPTTAEAYIHRLGRTGRAGKTGEGVILLSPVEKAFLQQIKNVPVVKSEKYTPEYIESISDFATGPLSHLEKRWEKTVEMLDGYSASDTFLSLVAYYSAHTTLIGSPPGKEILDSVTPFLTPFGVPVPGLSKMLEQSLFTGKAAQRRSRDQQRDQFQRRDQNQRFRRQDSHGGFSRSGGGNRFGGSRNGSRFDRPGDNRGFRRPDSNDRYDRSSSNREFRRPESSDRHDRSSSSQGFNRRPSW